MIKKTLILLIILISLSCLSCVDAKDLDNLTADALNQEESQILEVSQGSDDVLSVPDDKEIISESEKSSDKVYLVLDNDASKENINVGDYVIWYVSVGNLGPGVAKNVKVYDQLPEGLKFIKYKATQGTFNPKTGIWDIGDLKNGGLVFLDIFTQAITSGEKVNKVNVTCDSINLNNETYEEEEIDVFEYGYNHNSKSAEIIHSKTLKSTGNPLLLILFSLLGCFAVFIKKY
jgi:uncharacterized repeat protein (TIGR01451 family)